MSRINRPNITAHDLPGQFNQLKKHYLDTIDRLIFELNTLEKKVAMLEEEKNATK